MSKAPDDKAVVCSGAMRTSKSIRRDILSSAACVLALALPLDLSSAQAQSYPVRPIVMIAPFAAGGNLDVTARLVTEAMAFGLGQRIIIENRPGAGGMVGTEAAARADADGYTLVIVAINSLTVTPKLLARKTVSIADFSPVGLVTRTPMVLAVDVSSRFRTFAEFIAAARASPGRVTIGHAGHGTTNHIAILMLQKRLGVTFNVLAYRGGSPSLTDLMGGQIDAVIDQISGSVSHIQSGRLRPLAVTTLGRAEGLPDVPTLSELGVTDFDIGGMTGILAPAKTSQTILATLSRALNTALQRPEVQQRLRALGAHSAPSAPEILADLIQAEEQKADALLREGVLRPE